MESRCGSWYRQQINWSHKRRSIPCVRRMGWKFIWTNLGIQFRWRSGSRTKNRILAHWTLDGSGETRWGNRFFAEAGEKSFFGTTSDVGTLKYGNRLWRSSTSAFHLIFYNFGDWRCEKLSSWSVDNQLSQTQVARYRRGVSDVFSRIPSSGHYKSGRNLFRGFTYRFHCLFTVGSLRGGVAGTALFLAVCHTRSENKIQIPYVDFCDSVGPDSDSVHRSGTCR